MILKLLIFAIAGVVIYKFVGGKFPSIGQSENEKKLEEDTLVECEKCGTYVTQKESTKKEGKLYCSKECSK